jgi:hypothetical protein
MTTHIPLPEWTDLIAAALSLPPDEDALSKSWRGQDNAAIWYSRGSWVLAAVAKQLAQSKTASPLKFWIPDYFCNQSTVALREVGAKLVFYPIGEDLVPDWQRCDAMAKEEQPDIFLAVHYFGRPMDMARARQFCDSHEALLFEDAAHVLRPLPGMCGEADISLFCPHKTLPIPDGAVLMERQAGAFPAPSGRAPGAGSWMLKRAVQKLLPMSLLRSRNRRQAPEFTADPPLLPLPATPMMSASAGRMLMKVRPRLGQIDEARRRNAQMICARVTQMKLPLRTVFNSDGDGGFAPYRLVLQAPSPKQAANAYRVLIDAGFPAGTWPDLPPEVYADPTNHEWAIRYRQSLILLPVFHGAI